jgi:hypothetical protein
MQLSSVRQTGAGQKMGACLFRRAYRVAETCRHVLHTCQRHCAGQQEQSMIIGTYMASEVIAVDIAIS